MKAAVLAVQGAFAEHKKVLEELGISCVELRKREDLQQEFDGLVLPGGESTVQGKLIRELDMEKELKKRITEGLPVLATCAGMILLAEKIEGEGQTHLGLLPVTVKRNGYGRQLGSFQARGELLGIGCVPMTFIRAPYITETGKGVEILSELEGKIVGVRYDRMLALSFHPELDEDRRIHQYFIAQMQSFK